MDERFQVEIIRGLPEQAYAQVGRRSYQKSTFRIFTIMPKHPKNKARAGMMFPIQ